MAKRRNRNYRNTNENSLLMMVGLASIGLALAFIVIFPNQFNNIKDLIQAKGPSLPANITVHYGCNNGGFCEPLIPGLSYAVDGCGYKPLTKIHMIDEVTYSGVYGGGQPMVLPFNIAPYVGQHVSTQFDVPPADSSGCMTSWTYHAWGEGTHTLHGYQVISGKTQKEMARTLYDTFVHNPYELDPTWFCIIYSPLPAGAQPQVDNSFACPLIPALAIYPTTNQSVEQVLHIGDYAIIYGKNFQPGSTIYLGLDGTADSYPVTVDSTGKFSFTYPRQFNTEQYYIRLNATQGVNLVALIYFRVVP